MKICIITEPLACNYGGILQNYALQTVLKKHGHDPYTFDVGKFTWFDWFVNCTAILCHKLSGKKLEFEKSPYYRKTKETPLRKFVVNKIALVKPRQKRLNLKCLKKYKFDAYIVGSDQVWRPKYNSDLTDKFLAFLGNEKGKRIAYAASFGSDFWEFSNSQTEECSKLVKLFNAISVREESGVTLCKNHLQIEVSHVLDPTLLLSSYDYEMLCKNVVCRSPFIFAYILNYNEKKILEIKSFSKTKNLPIYFLGADNQVQVEDSIEKWLSLFRDAKYIITDSFHGTAFSIIFNKDFLVYENKERGNSRFYSLLKKFNLQNRIVKTILNKTPNIEWNKVNSILMNEKKQSIQWILSNL